MIAPVMSLAQLRAKANKDPKYRSLAILAAEKLGYETDGLYDTAMFFLQDAINSEWSEDDVIEEVNALRGEVG